ncbi:MAG: hypothetical protein NTY07_16240 [Bacteroidia bacterium]|nr:hypothetical protein [Bacteroidia bacterium]
MDKKALVILSGNISSTPRAIKVINLIRNTHTVDVLYVKRNVFWDKQDTYILKKNYFDSYSIKYSSISVLKKILIRIISVISRHLFNWGIKNIHISAWASQELNILFFFKTKKNDYEIIFSHSGSLYPAKLYSKNFKIPVIIDIEDYHPGEQIENDPDNEKLRREYLMEQLLPKAKLVTYASPLIGKAILNLSCSTKIKNHLLINNCFPSIEFIEPRDNSTSKKVRFVWFSQTISYNRGLELILPVLDRFSGKISISLIGNLNSNFFEKCLKQYSFLEISPPLLQHQLHNKLSEFDIGLAIELNSSDFNRQICLTNKLFSYLQAGLYILATDTPAQIDFINSHQSHGLICKQNSNDVESMIVSIIENISKIRDNKCERFLDAKKFDWEEESLKFQF